MFRGLRESDVALKIALRVAAVCTWSRACEVILTRHDDSPVRLDDRPAFAKDHGATVLISIHANADADPDTQGMQEARGDEVWYHPMNPGGLLVARAVGRALRTEFPAEPYRGEKAGDLCVLRLAAMPACLAEVGFIDCSATAESFQDPTTIDRISLAILRGALYWEATR
jgi:N-acetylmuramoyl-L-alanine amidase